MLRGAAAYVKPSATTVRKLSLGHKFAYGSSGCEVKIRCMVEGLGLPVEG